MINFPKWCYHSATPAGIVREGRICSQATWFRGSTHIILKNGEEFTADMSMPWSVIWFSVLRLLWRIGTILERFRR